MAPLKPAPEFLYASGVFMGGGGLRPGHERLRSHQFLGFFFICSGISWIGHDDSCFSQYQGIDEVQMETVQQWVPKLIDIMAESRLLGTVIMMVEP